MTTVLNRPQLVKLMAAAGITPVEITFSRLYACPQPTQG